MKGLLFTYGLTYGGAVIALVRPYIALLIFVCFAILRPASLWHWSVPEGNYSRIIGVALVVGWVLHGMGNWRMGRATAMLWCLMAFWIWVAIGSFMAEHQPAGWERLEAMSKTFLPVLIGLTLIDSMTKVKLLAWVIVMSQGYLALEFNLAYLSGHFNPLEFDHGALDNNGMSIVMVSCIGFAFFLGLDAERWWLRAVALVAALLMLHFVLFSMSRGGMFALLVTGLVSFVLIPKTWRHYAGLAVAVAIVARLAGPPVIERFETALSGMVKSADGELQTDRSAQSRLAYWAAAIQAMNDHPIFGMGSDQWRFRCPDYGVQFGRAVHSTWLQVGAEHGYAGLAFYALFYLLCLWRLWPLAKQAPAYVDPSTATLARMVIASMVGFVISGQFVTMHGVDAPYFIALVGAGILKVASWRPQTRTVVPHHAPLTALMPMRWASQIQSGANR